MLKENTREIYAFCTIFFFIYCVQPPCFVRYDFFGDSNKLIFTSEIIICQALLSPLERQCLPHTLVR